MNKIYNRFLIASVLCSVFSCNSVFSNPVVKNGSNYNGILITNTSSSGSNTATNSIAIGDRVYVGKPGSNAIVMGYGVSTNAHKAIVIGNNSTALGESSIALGTSAVVSKDIIDSVAIGSRSNANESNVISVGHKIGDADKDGNVYETNEYRRIINVADGIEDNDAVTYGQFSSEIENRIDAFNSLDNRIGTLEENGNYIRKSNFNSVSDNLRVLDYQIKATNENIIGFSNDITRNKNNIRNLNSSVSAALSSVSSTSMLVNTLNDIKADVSLNNLSDSGRQIIATVATTAVQEYMANHKNTNSLSVTDVGNGSLFVGKGNNVTGSQSIAIGVGNQVNANNAGAFGDPSIINADESYVLGNDDTVNTGAIASFIVGNDSVSNAKGSLLFGSNSNTEATAENGVGLGNQATVSGKNSVALGYQSTAMEDNVVSVGNDSLKRRITNIADGTLSSDSTDAVTGKQLYVTNEKVEENKLAIAQKADRDASNIDTVAWAEKLGTGKVQENDSNLVTGGTVFNAISAMEQNNPVQATNEGIFIGANQTDNVISIYNKNGEGRVITGVMTNPKDTSSAANVGYVNAVGESIMGAVNNSLGQLDTKVNKVGANAAAMASLTPASFEGDEKWSLSAGVGNYKGETAGAVGAFYRPAENVLMNVRGSFGNNENMVGAAVSVSLSKGDVPGVTKRQLANTVNRQANAINQLQQNQVQYENKIAEQNDRINEQDRQIKELMKRLEAVEKR